MINKLKDWLLFNVFFIVDVWSDGETWKVWFTPFGRLYLWRCGKKLK